MKWMLSSDQQMPYHDPRAVELWFKVLKWFKPQVIDYLGDQDDQACYSRWTEGRSAEFTAMYKEEEGADKVLPYIKAEATVAKDFYAQTRKMMPRSEIFVALGNHDIRVFDYVDKKLRDIRDTVTPNYLWGLDDLGIDYIYYSDRPKLRYGGLYAHHGVSISKHAGESVRNDVDQFGVSIVRGHCFSEDTEVLTPEGWKDYTEIDIGSIVYTMNEHTMRGEYQGVTDKFVYSDYTELVAIKGMCIDALVTPDHQMLTIKNNGKVARTPAKELFNQYDFVIPLAVELSSEEADITDDQIKMVSWVMAEGNFDPYTMSSGEVRHRIRISQSDAPDGRLGRLINLMERCGITPKFIKRYDADTTEHGSHRNFDAYRANFLRSECQWIFDYIDPLTKAPIGEMLNLSARQAQLFLMEYVWSDGCKNSDAKNSYQLATNNLIIRDYLQWLSVISGWRSSVIPRPNDMWCVTINTRNSMKMLKQNLSMVEYGGNVWCVTVPNHSLVVRRKGKTFVAGNSHRLSLFNKTYPLREETLRGYEIGHMSDINSEGMGYTNIHNWQQGFAYAHIDGDNVHMNLVEIKEDYSCVVDGKVFKG